MDLTNKDTIINLAKKMNISPSARSGQNFLLSQEYLNTIINTAKLNKHDMVLEVGPGFGVLTIKLLESGAKVFSFEIDKKLAVFMKRYETLFPNFKIINADILKSWAILNDNFKDLQYKLVANLPYNITSKLLREFMETSPRPKEMVIMIQKEVADRITATPGKMSVLAVAVQFYGVPKKIIDLKSENFWPQPEVDSSIIKISKIGIDSNGYGKRLSPYNSKDFFRCVKIGFSAKRKQLHNNLSNGFGISNEKTAQKLNKIKINPNIRAQDLTIDEWISITHNFTK